LKLILPFVVLGLVGGGARVQYASGYSPYGAMPFLGAAPGSFYAPALGWSSTVQEGVLRGWGEAAIGMGFYNYYSAMAGAIQADTLMRANQYAYGSYLETERRYNQRKTYEHTRQVVARQKVQDRLVNEPQLSDVYRGEALNALAWLIADMKIHPSAQRFTGVSLAGGTLDRIPLVHAATKTTFSKARLDVKDRWPRLLRDPAFAAARRHYEAALDQALDQVFNRKLTQADIDALDEAVSNLQARFQDQGRWADEDDRRQCQQFIDKLAETVRTLRQPQMELVLLGVMNYLGTSVADLLAFMQQNQLQFGKAETPQERELYQTLQPLLAQHRARLESQKGAMK
jgi:hypothetical protein